MTNQNLHTEKGARKALTQQKLRHVLRYDHETGDFTWLRNRNRFLVGEKAGCVWPTGYVAIKIGGKAYLAHRLAWLYRTGEWPEHEIDHINRDRSDNRFANLRDVTRSLNRANSAIGANNMSGYRGVHRSGSKWVSSIRVDGKSFDLGRFESPEEALRAYVDASYGVPGRIVGELRKRASA